MYKHKFLKYNKKTMDGGLLCNPAINKANIEELENKFKFDGNYDIGFSKIFLNGRIVVIRLLNQFNMPIPVGKGNFGTVYKGKGIFFYKNKIGEIDLTIKDMNLTDEYGKNMICSELLSVCQLNHPNILTYYGFNESNDNKIVILMEFLEGKDLYYNLKNRFLSVNDKVKISIDLLEGLNYLHKNNIFHRDIKLENIMIKKYPNNETINVKYIGFNFSCKTNLSCETSKYKIGSLHYISPEFLRSFYGKEEEIQEKKDMYLYYDLWALGITLYVMFFEKYLFDVENQKDLFDKIMNINQKDIDEKLANLPYFKGDINIHPDYQYVKSNIISLLKVNPLERMIIPKVERRLDMTEPYNIAPIQTPVPDQSQDLVASASTPIQPQVLSNSNVQELSKSMVI